MLHATINRWIKIALTFAPITLYCNSIPLHESAGIDRIVFLHITGRESMLFLSKSSKESKLVIPSCAIWIRTASELSFMLELDFSQLRKAADSVKFTVSP